MNLWEKISPGSTEEFNVIVEIPKGSSNKYEYDHEKGILKLDRSFYTSMQEPGNYGFIPQTIAGDGDALDVLLLSTYPIYPKVIVKARPVGAVILEDEKGQDDKIIAIPIHDPRFEEIKEVTDLSKFLKEEILHFFEHYKEIEPKKWVKFKKWGNKRIAKEIIKNAIKKYEEKCSK